MRFIGFVGPTYATKSVNVDCQRCINLYPEINEVGSGKDKEIASLVSTPGLKLLCNVGTGPIRGSWATSTGALYVVSGNGLYKISRAWVPSLIGTLSTSLGVVSMADNGISLFIVDGQYGYTNLLSNDTFAIVSDPNFQPASKVTYQDGYFVFCKTNSGQFFISGLYATTFNASNVATSEGNPDNIVSILSVHRDLWVFNAQTTEVFYDSGDVFPFTRIQGAFIEHGCIAQNSVAKGNNSVFWLGQDFSGSGIVYAATGYQPQRISTHAVEQAIQKYSTLTDATAYTYQENGHNFYVLNFPTANATWVYDTATSLWHERAYFNNGTYERHRADNHAYFNQTHVVGDYSNGNLYSLSSSVYTDNGNWIPRRRIAPHISSQGSLQFFSQLQLDIEAGTGLDGIQQGTDPQAMMKFSDDGGHTWSNEKWVSTGKIGQTRKRAIWRRLGSSRDRVFDITITDPASVTIIGANIDYSGAANDG